MSEPSNSHDAVDPVGDGPHETGGRARDSLATRGPRPSQPSAVSAALPRRSGPAPPPLAPSWCRAMRLMGHLALPALFFVVVWVLHPFADVFVFDPDEGNNLIKARLLGDGFRLYTEIWNDQPPLFTYLLGGWLELTEWTVSQGRVFVLLCSSVLLWALYQSVRLTAGVAAAVISCLLLVVSLEYVRLSVSVMLAVPSLMFAMLSIYAVIRYSGAKHGAWLVLSGVCLALSVFTKMWTGLLVPVVGLGVLLAARHGPPEARGAGSLRSIAVWTAGLVLAAGALFVAMVPLEECGQLVRPHLEVRQAGDFEGYADAFWGHLQSDWVIVLLGLVGSVQAVYRRDWLLLIPAAWVALALVALAWHQPLWYHHYLLLSVPICWAAGSAAGTVFSRPGVQVGTAWRGLRMLAADAGAKCGPRAATAWAAARGLPALVAIVVVAVGIPTVYQRDFGRWYSDDSKRDRHLLAIMAQFSQQTHYVVTDRQILPFRAGLPVPPPLSVTSLKRQWSGHLTSRQLIGVLEQYHPEQILLSGHRIRLTDELIGYLAPRYQHVYSDPWGTQFLITNDLAASIVPVVVRATRDVPDCWEAHLNLGHQLRAAGRVDEAIRAFQRAHRWLPPRPRYAQMRQHLLQLSQLTDDAG